MNATNSEARKVELAGKKFSANYLLRIPPAAEYMPPELDEFVATVERLERYRLMALRAHACETASVFIPYSKLGKFTMALEAMQQGRGFIFSYAASPINPGQGIDVSIVFLQGPLPEPLGSHFEI